MSFNRLDLNLLRVFDAIFQTRSVTVAASNLHLTQPAVSKQLNRLRELLEDPLFVRTNDGMAPTPRAEALAGPVRQALSEVRNAIERQLGFDPLSSDRTFRIFTSDLGQMVFLPKLLDLISREAPAVNIHTVQVPAQRMRGVALESGDVDLAVGYFEELRGPFINRYCSKNTTSASCARIIRPFATRYPSSSFCKLRIWSINPPAAGTARRRASSTRHSGRQGSSGGSPCAWRTPWELLP